MWGWMKGVLGWRMFNAHAEDATPTAFGNYAPLTSDAIMKKILNAVPVP